MRDTVDPRRAAAADHAGRFGAGIAYVKGVVVDGQLLFAIMDGDGRQLGIAGNRELAFAAARQHDFEPVSVH